MPADSPRILGVIPARIASTRLPRKLLRQVAGRPLLAWVVDAARACRQLSELLVAADSEEIAALCRTLGVRVELTSPELASGTDRLHAVAQLHQAEIYVNIQGDEPLLHPDHIAGLLRPFTRPDVEVTTLKVRCTPENIANPNAVKVVTTGDGRALYFSRATIPFHRETPSPCHPDPEQSEGEGPASTSAPIYWKHIGLYAYRRSALLRFPALPHSQLERAERLEQLRFLENGLDIFVEPTEHDTIGVDTEADLAAVEERLQTSSLGRLSKAEQPKMR